MRIPMLFRFSLYGFLKNQQYYDPFLILIFLEKGLSYFLIGILIAFREICVNIFEIPSGAVADLYGRRRAMILSFAAYIVSFVVFALSRSIVLLFCAMFFFAIGEAFRTGTHKAMIFNWLQIEGRSDEKTKTYGYTRSWSKMGSALSVLIASGLVFYTGDYSKVFLFCIIPYMVGIINFLGYPAALDGDTDVCVSLRAVAVFLWSALKQAARYRSLRRLIIESMGFEGMFKVSKDYFQPILKQTALALPLFLTLADKKRTALLIGVVNFVLYILSSIASRHSHRLAEWKDGEDRAARFIWVIDWMIYASLIPLLWFRLNYVVIVFFVFLAIMQNFWRPLLISRINAHSTPEMGATVLSIESQAKSFATMLIAPVLGWLVDITGAFWPVGVFGAVIATLIVITARPLEDVQITQS
ncbi:MFS transporter [Candidatus Poribacteria bacterium]